MGFELMTSSLPRMRSTPELHRLFWSGRRGSNSRPSAWKADALPTELLPQKSAIFALLSAAPRNTNEFVFARLARQFRHASHCGGRWTRTTEPEGADLQSAAIAAMRSPQVSLKQLVKARAERGIRTHDPEITNHVLWPTELFRRYFKDTLCKRDCKDRDLIRFSKTFSIIFIEPQEL